MMTSDKMLSHVTGATGWMTFNNPERHNAVSLDMWAAAETILGDFAADDAVRVVVLTGAGGKSFVSGADISKFEAERSNTEAVAHYNEVTAGVFCQLEAMHKPTIAMIDGYCLGGGLGISVACDLRFCSDKSQFGLPAARLGLGYSYDGLRRLVDTVGLAFAKEIVFTAERFEAPRALTMGLVNRVVAAAKLEPTVSALAKTIAANAPLTVTAMKRTIGEIAKDPAERDREMCRQVSQVCFDSEDYIEGRRAFMEKRKAVFVGR